MKFPNWHERPEQFSPGEAANGKLDGHYFIQMANQFISLTNKRNRKADTTEIQMVMLFAATATGRRWTAESYALGRPARCREWRSCWPDRAG